MFYKYYLFREMASFSLPHPISVDGSNMPCHGKIGIAYVDMRFEDYSQAKNFPQGTPFWAKLPGSSIYLVYNGDRAQLLNSRDAAPYIEQYKAAPSDWWKWAEALDKDYNRIKQPERLRGDFEKVDPNACIPVGGAVLPHGAR
jgi:hypothetical protein